MKNSIIDGRSEEAAGFPPNITSMYSFSRGVGSGVWNDRGVTIVFEPKFRAIVLHTSQYGLNQ